MLVLSNDEKMSKSPCFKSPPSTREALHADEQFSYTKTPPFLRISQSDCNSEQCELFRTKNKRSQSIPVDGGPLIINIIISILLLLLLLLLTTATATATTTTTATTTATATAAAAAATTATAAAAAATAAAAAATATTTNDNYNNLQ